MPSVSVALLYGVFDLHQNYASSSVNVNETLWLGKQALSVSNAPVSCVLPQMLLSVVRATSLGIRLYRSRSASLPAATCTNFDLWIQVLSAIFFFLKSCNTFCLCYYIAQSCSLAEAMQDHQAWIDPNLNSNALPQSLVTQVFCADARSPHSVNECKHTAQPALKISAEITQVSVNLFSSGSNSILDVYYRLIISLCWSLPLTYYPLLILLFSECATTKASDLFSRWTFTWLCFPQCDSRTVFLRHLAIYIPAEPRSH